MTQRPTAAIAAYGGSFHMNGFGWLHRHGLTLSLRGLYVLKDAPCTNEFLIGQQFFEQSFVRLTVADADDSDLKRGINCVTLSRSRANACYDAP